MKLLLLAGIFSWTLASAVAERGTWNVFGRYQYYVSKQGDIRTYDEGEAFCKYNDGEMAMIKTSQIQTFIQDQVSNGSGSPYGFLIGLREVGSSNVYRWNDGEELNYKNWETSEPNDVDGIEPCAIMGWYFSYEANLLWRDVPCSPNAPSGFVCQRLIGWNWGSWGAWGDCECPGIKQRNRTCLESGRNGPYSCNDTNTDNEACTVPPECNVTTPMVTTTPIPLERGNWVANGSYQYYVSPGNKSRSYSYSQKYCQDQDAELALIKTQQTHDFIKSLVKDGSGTPYAFYIGLKYNKSGAKFVWNDGTDLAFEHWDEGEPNNHDGGTVEETCVAIGEQNTYHESLPWHTMNCETGIRGPKGLVCQRRIGKYWGSWSSWSICNCTITFKTRNRTCLDTSRSGTDYCVGASNETANCTEEITHCFTTMETTHITTSIPVIKTTSTIVSITVPVTTTEQPTTTVPVLTITEPEETTTVPVMATTEPEETITEQLITTVLATTTKAPEKTTTEQLTTTAISVMTTTEPEETTTKQLTTTVPATTTKALEKTTTDQLTTTAIPVKTTTEPEGATTIPVMTTTEPEETITEQPTTLVPATTTTKPEEATTIPVMTTTEPEETITEQPTTTVLATTTKAPEKTTTEQLTTTAISVKTTTEPEGTTTVPATTTTKPEETTTIPVMTTTEPEETITEQPTTTVIATTTKAPKKTTTEHLTTTAIPVMTPTVPEETTTKQLTTTVPATTTTKPEETTTIPPMATTEPEETTTEEPTVTLPVTTTPEMEETTTLANKTTASATTSQIITKSDISTTTAAEEIAVSRKLPDFTNASTVDGNQPPTPAAQASITGPIIGTIAVILTLAIVAVLILSKRFCKRRGRGVINEQGSNLVQINSQGSQEDIIGNPDGEYGHGGYSGYQVTTSNDAYSDGEQSSERSSLDSQSAKLEYENTKKRNNLPQDAETAEDNLDPQYSVVNENFQKSSIQFSGDDVDEPQYASVDDINAVTNDETNGASYATVNKPSSKNELPIDDAYATVQKTKPNTTLKKDEVVYATVNKSKTTKNSVPAVMPSPPSPQEIEITEEPYAVVNKK